MCEFHAQLYNLEKIFNLNPFLLGNPFLKTSECLQTKTMDKDPTHQNLFLGYDRIPQNLIPSSSYTSSPSGKKRCLNPLSAPTATACLSFRFFGKGFCSLPTTGNTTEIFV